MYKIKSSNLIATSVPKKNIKSLMLDLVFIIYLFNTFICTYLNTSNNNKYLYYHF